jgi:hypothetical protein
LFYGSCHPLVCFSYINIRQKLFCPFQKKKKIWCSMFALQGKTQRWFYWLSDFTSFSINS